MDVTLVSTTPEADVLLIATKRTRLELRPSMIDEVRAMSREARDAELRYMADTIPSSWEFVDYSFLVTGVSRAYTHQQVRTRAASYAQQTMRVTNQADFGYIYTDRIEGDSFAKSVVDGVLDEIRAGYRTLLAMGIPAEDARGILPTNISTNIFCKFNLRTMAELARSRTGGRTQGEYQRVVNLMIDRVLEVHPWAEAFLFSKARDYFAELEAFAKEEWPDDLLKRGRLLKIIDKMRKEA